MALYEELKRVDFLDGIEEVITEKKIDLDKDQRLVFVPRFNADRPWVNTPNSGVGRKCDRWFGLYFILWGLVPRECRNCWKVVCHPQTLEGLLMINKLQMKMKLPAKCGNDTRDYVPHLYSAFWYTSIMGGLEGGRELHKRMEPEIKKILGEETKVILKRSCTEFEVKLGPSDKWEYSENDRLLEEILDSTIALKNELGESAPPYLDLHVTRKWIEWAWRRGDPTVEKFIDEPLWDVPRIRKKIVDSVPPVTYHNSKHKNEDFRWEPPRGYKDVPEDNS